MSSVGDELMGALRHSYLLHNFTGTFEKLQKDQLMKAYLRLLLIVNNNNRFDGEDSSDAAISRHILRCLSLCELSHLVGTGGSKVLFTPKVALKILSALHNTITAKHGAKASQRTRMAMKAEDVAKAKGKRNPLPTDVVTVKENIPEEQLLISAPVKGKELHRTPVRPQNSNEYEDTEDDTSLNTPKHEPYSEERPIKHLTANLNLKYEPSKNIKSASSADQTFDEKPVKSASSVANQTFDEKPIKSASSVANQTFDEKPVKSASSVASQTFDEKPIKSASSSDQSFDEKPPKYSVDYDERPIKPLDTNKYYTVTEDDQIDEITDNSVEDFKYPHDLENNSGKENDLSFTEDSNSSELSDKEVNSEDEVIMTFKEPLCTYKATSKRMELKDKRRTFVIGKEAAVAEDSPSLDYANTPSDQQVSYVANMDSCTIPNFDFLPANATYLCTPSHEVASLIKKPVSSDDEKNEDVPALSLSEDFPALNLSTEESPKIESLGSARTSKSLIDSCESSLNESAMNIFPRNRKKENEVKSMAKEVTKKLSARAKKEVKEIEEDDISPLIVNRAATRRRGKIVVKTEPNIKTNKKPGSDNISRKKKDIQKEAAVSNVDAEPPSNDIVEGTQSKPGKDTSGPIVKLKKEPLRKSRKKKDIKEEIAVTNLDAESPSNDKVVDTQGKLKDSPDTIVKPTKEPLRKSRKKKIEETADSIDNANVKSERDSDVEIFKGKKAPPKKSRKKKVDEENEIINNVDYKLKSEDIARIEDKSPLTKIDNPTKEPSKKLRKVEDSVGLEDNSEEIPKELPKKRGRKPAAKKKQLADNPDSKVEIPIIPKKKEVDIDPEGNDLDTQLKITNAEDLRITGRRKKQVNYCELTPSTKLKKVASNDTKEVNSVDMEATDQEAAGDLKVVKPKTQGRRKKIIPEDDTEAVNVLSVDTKTKPTMGGRKKKTDNEATDVVIPEKRGRSRAVNEVEEDESPPKTRKIESKTAAKARKAKLEKTSPENEISAPRNRRVLRR